MKKTFLLFLGLSGMISCSKDAGDPLDTSADCLCLSRDGIMMRCSELKNNAPSGAQMTGEPLKYKWKYCTTEDNRVGALCTSGVNPDCRNSFPCTYCANCQ